MAVSSEKLIEVVRKREILYASVLKTYKDIQQKDRAWLEVAEEIGVGDEAGGIQYVRDDYPCLGESFDGFISVSEATEVKHPYTGHKIHHVIFQLRAL